MIFHDLKMFESPLSTPVVEQPFQTIGCPDNRLSACRTTNMGYGTTNMGHGTTNADAGVGIGLKRGIQKIDKKGN